jgi:MFS transporter, PPP family, 3-phenylpropionic acid transporter
LYRKPSVGNLQRIESETPTPESFRDVRMTLKSDHARVFLQSLFRSFLYMLNSSKIRLLYLFIYMAFAIWRVFYNIYLEEIGLKGSQIATLNALMQSTIFFVVAFWGMVADKKGIRPTLRILVLISAIGVYYLSYIQSFWSLLIYIPILTLFYHPMGPLTDALATQFAKFDKKHSYGSFRLWGSLGWGIAAVLGGLVFSRVPIKYVFPTSSVLFLVTIIFLSTRKRSKTFTPNFQAFRIKEILNNKPLLFTAVTIILYGFACSPVNSYLNLYFTELNVGNNIVGYAYAIMAFSELPLFILGNRLLIKWGAQRIIMLAMLAMLLRFVLYGLFPVPSLALAIGALQGVSLSFFLVGIVDYLHRLLPEGRHATAQSLIWGLYIGVGQTSGNLFIGGLIDNIGMVGIMRVFIPVTLVCLIYSGWYFWGYGRIGKSR